LRKLLRAGELLREGSRRRPLRSHETGTQTVKIVALVNFISFVHLPSISVSRLSISVGFIGFVPRAAFVTRRASFVHRASALVALPSVSVRRPSAFVASVACLPPRPSESATFLPSRPSDTFTFLPSRRVPYPVGVSEHRGEERKEGGARAIVN
jgi:hypothetical protein